MSNDVDQTTMTSVEVPDDQSERREIESLVQLFKLLADETRFRILLFLIQDSELNVKCLCDMLGQSQPAVSHHLALLRVAGLIECRRDGKHNFYRIIRDKVQSHIASLLKTVGPSDIVKIPNFDTGPLESEQAPSS